jgi:hypothetical protein
MQTACVSTCRQAIGQLAVGASLPMTSAAAGEDPHVAWHAEWRRLHDQWNRSDLDTFEAAHPTWLRLGELEGLIVDTQASTAQGMLAQIDVALASLDVDERANAEARALVSLRASLIAAS